MLWLRERVAGKGREESHALISNGKFMVRLGWGISVQEFSAHQLTHTPMSAHTRQPKLCTFCIYSEAQPSHKHMQASQCLAYDFSSPYKSAVQANCCCVCLFLQFLIWVWFAAFTPFLPFQIHFKAFFLYPFCPMCIFTFLFLNRTLILRFLM